VDGISAAEVAPNFSVQIPGAFSPQTGSGSTSTKAGVILPGEHSVCGWITSFEDQVVEACGSSTPVLSGPFTQVIEVVDDVEPELVSGPSAITQSVGHFACTASPELPSAVTVIQIKYFGEIMKMVDLSLI